MLMGSGQPDLTPYAKTADMQDWMGGQMTARDNALAALQSAVLGIARYRKVLTTAATGIYTGALGGAGLFLAEPAIEITPKMAADNFDWRYDLSGSAAAGYSITVVFTRRNNTVLGNLTTLLAGISLINTPVATTFSLTASEQSA